MFPWVSKQPEAEVLGEEDVVVTIGKYRNQPSVRVGGIKRRVRIKPVGLMLPVEGGFVAVEWGGRIASQH